jgi:hypothetical protein
MTIRKQIKIFLPNGQMLEYCNDDGIIIKGTKKIVQDIVIDKDKVITIVLSNTSVREYYGLPFEIFQYAV